MQLPVSFPSGRSGARDRGPCKRSIPYSAVPDKALDWPPAFADAAFAPAVPPAAVAGGLNTTLSVQELPAGSVAPQVPAFGAAALVKYVGLVPVKVSPAFNVVAPVAAGLVSVRVWKALVLPRAVFGKATVAGVSVGATSVPVSESVRAPV
jgi:hypothetical protein